jgi:hypothetical protein
VSAYYPCGKAFNAKNKIDPTPKVPRTKIYDNNTNSWLWFRRPITPNITARNTRRKKTKIIK